MCDSQIDDERIYAQGLDHITIIKHLEFDDITYSDYS